MEPEIGADERTFRLHTERPDFLVGQKKGYWRLIAVTWPQALIGVTARDGTEWVFRFLLDGYPGQLPNACPWDEPNAKPLDAQLWPKSGGRFAAAFNPGWNAQALYLPCDRAALPGHEHWLVQHPEKKWPPARGIIHYLEIIHDLLASFEHHPVVQPAA